VKFIREILEPKPEKHSVTILVGGGFYRTSLLKEIMDFIQTETMHVYYDEDMNEVVIEEIDPETVERIEKQNEFAKQFIRDAINEADRNQLLEITVDESDFDLIKKDSEKNGEDKKEMPGL